MAFHGSVWGDHPGPEKVVEEFIHNSQCFRKVGFLDSITFGEKVRGNTLKDRVMNRYIRLLKIIR